MNAMTKAWMQVRVRIVSMNRTRRIAVALAGLALMGGGIALVCMGGAEPLSPVLNQPLGEPELTAWSSALAMHGLDAQVRDQRLMVAAKDLQAARAALAYEGMINRDLVGAFEQVAKEDDIWRTGEQNDKRWQAAKMATLSKLIGMFPPVRAATVILEPGAQRTLGAPAHGATASVTVTLKDGRKMSSQLVDAIADLVCGSVSGMERQDVRIIDSAGRSHRAGAAGSVDVQEQLENLRLAESYFAQRIRSALSYVDNIVVAVEVAPSDLTRCRRASVSVPRSYLAATAGVPDVQAGQVPPQLARIQQTAASAAGLAHPADVAVDWYYDVPSRVAAVKTPEAQSDLLVQPPALWAGAVLAFGILAVAANAFRRRWSAARRAELPTPLPMAASLPSTDEGRSCTLGLLQHLHTDSLIELVRGEHPQTIAIVLSHLGISKAAAVLGALSPQEQVDVSRRMAALEKLDAQVVTSVERSLSARLAATPVAQREQLGGVGAVAQMLYHAGYATGHSVLQGLAAQEPALADSIRRRMFSLEDVAALPPDRLSAALAEVNEEHLSMALYAAGEPVQSKILAALGTRSRRVRQGMANLSPVRLSDVEAAQETVLEAVRREEGLYVAQDFKQVVVTP